ncbi:Na+/H+ antiporter NhaA [Terasakiella sp. A23]|uniref:Na+/H+ antiporter NhaA n=1 Tax=Terasakiella sp. FCG-A23 TaxID=3080561 RepID=UPI002954E027|nr:Na+/H+ antiporter NhaA [Terasakiella sp. A23]MDV7340497.1 Na+/H+ antiporter NhaA [Terasakiella sp. A23]
MTNVSTEQNGFINKETAGGLLLIGAAFLALIVNNSALSSWYMALLNAPVIVQAGPLEINKPLLLWVNDGLMAIFFFLVGLEIKREVMEGELSTFDRAALPLIAAVGGMLIPALVYLGVNLSTPENFSGWAIPAATDIAFALGILALLGPRVPVALKVFLLGIAIIDDLGAIIAIALFYTDNLSTTSLMFGLGGFGLLVALNRMGVRALAPYVLIGLVVWVGVLKSGVHATLAGVMIALTVPLAEKGGHSPLKHVEHGLHPWVAFMIIPIFAFFNSGVSFAGMSFASLLQPLPLGIALGLFVGKQIGVFSFSWIAVKIGICRLPRGVNWMQVYGVACLTGIGFTMSLFIGTLAFETSEQLNAVRLGVIMGSILSTFVGVIVLKRSLADKKQAVPAGATSAT